MQKSYVAKTTINFVDFEFYVRSGDLLVHDTANQNRLTVYRNGQIVKVVKQDPIGIVAFLKNKFIEEVNPPAAVKPVAAPVAKVEPVAPPAPVEALTSPTRAAELATKRRKMHAEEVLINDNPRLMQALGRTAEEPKQETEIETKTE